MPRLLTPEELAGIHAKLDRADENIHHLEEPAGGFSEDQYNRLGEWAEFHAKHRVPPRFGVFAGEIAHLLRSSLDNIAWLLTCDSYRKSDERSIGFPVFNDRPVAEGEKARYERQIKGITSTDALKVIESVQPYNAGDDAPDHPLAIVHKLNRVDKHHTIVLVVVSFDAGLRFPTEMFSPVVFGPSSEVSQEEYVERFQHKIEIKVTRNIAFERFGKRKLQPVIPSLTHLANAVRDVVKLFDS